MKPSLIPLLLAAALGACAAPEAAKQAVVSGEAAYRERIAMPPGTRFEAVLQDISRADAGAVTLGQTVIENAGQPPYRFTIAYDPAAIDPRHTYAVRATLRHEGKLLFTTDTVTPVINNGKTADIRLLMVKVGP